MLFSLIPDDGLKILNKEYYRCRFTHVLMARELVLYSGDKFIFVEEHKGLVYGSVYGYYKPKWDKPYEETKCSSFFDSFLELCSMDAPL